MILLCGQPCSLCFSVSVSKWKIHSDSSYLLFFCFELFVFLKPKQNDKHLSQSSHHISCTDIFITLSAFRQFVTALTIRLDQLCLRSVVDCCIFRLHQVDVARDAKNTADPHLPHFFHFRSFSHNQISFFKYSI